MSENGEIKESIIERTISCERILILPALSLCATLADICSLISPLFMKSRLGSIIAWICAILVSALNIFAALTKFIPSMAGDAGMQFANQVGMANIEYQLGVVEVICVVLFLIPRTSTIGFVLMVGYMSGVLATNITHGFGFADTWMLYLALLLLTVSAYFRNPELLTRLRNRPIPE